MVGKTAAALVGAVVFAILAPIASFAVLECIPFGSFHGFLLLVLAGGAFGAAFGWLFPWVFRFVLELIDRA